MGRFILITHSWDDDFLEYIINIDQLRDIAWHQFPTEGGIDSFLEIAYIDKTTTVINGWNDNEQFEKIKHQLLNQENSR